MFERLATLGFALCSVLLLGACTLVSRPSASLTRELPAGQTPEAELQARFAPLLSPNQATASKALNDHSRLTRAWLDSIELNEGPLDLAKLERHFDVRPTGFPSEFTFDRLLASERVFPLRNGKHHTREGAGVPVVLYQTGRSEPYLAPCGRTHPATALLKPAPSSAAKPILELHSTLDHSVATMGAHTCTLAADFGADIEFFWEQSDTDNRSIPAMFRPGEPTFDSHLYLTEPYDPEKIPLVLLHGLGAGPDIFTRMMTAVRADEQLRSRYQIWHFAYPTGVPWPFTAADFRREIRAARQHFDPNRSHPNFDRMVLVGHSMGGVISRLSVCKPNDLMYREVFRVDPDKLQGSEEDKALLREALILEPLTEPKRIICLATPHGGSKVAGWGVVSLTSSAILLPTKLATSLVDLATLNQLHLSESLKDRPILPNSLQTLTAGSPCSTALQQMPLRDEVHAHSIIGVVDISLLGELGDGVVPYNSAHIPAKLSAHPISEKTIPTHHAMAWNSRAIEETLRILRLHLKTIAQ